MASNCTECGAKVDVVEFVFSGVKKIIVPRYCSDCSERLSKEHDEADRALTISRSLSACRLPLACLSILKEGSYKLTKGQEFAFSKVSHKDLWNKPAAYLWGPVGSGKTFCASKLLYDYIKETSQEAYFVSIANIISHKYASVQEDPSDLRGPLVLDDLGNHIVNQKVVSFLFNVINHRLNTGLPTIITCNTDPISLSERLVSAIGSSESYLVESMCDRILELCTPVKVDGKSIRTKKFLKANAN